MVDLKVAVLGATPNRIGYHHAREFYKAGANLVAVLRSSEDGARCSARFLEENFGIRSAPYWNLEYLLEKEKPDAVSVCTPKDKHYEHTKLALLSGAHVLCEKPVYWDSSKTPAQNLSEAEELFRLAAERKRVFTVNTQLVYLLDQYLVDYGAAARDRLEFELITAGKGNGLEIPIDLLPHALSFLLRAWQIKDIKGIDGAYSADETNLLINLDADKNTAARIKLGKQGAKKLRFGFEGAYVTRESKNGSGNEIYYYLQRPDNGTQIPVDDALKVSISRFVRSVTEHNPQLLLVPPEESLANIRLQSEIMEHLLSSGN